MNFNPLRLFGARPQKRALDESSELYRALAIYNQTASGFSVNDETALPTPQVPAYPWSGLAARADLQLGGLSRFGA